MPCCYSLQNLGGNLACAKLPGLSVNSTEMDATTGLQDSGWITSSRCEKQSYQLSANCPEKACLEHYKGSQD